MVSSHDHMHAKVCLVPTLTGRRTWPVNEQIIDILHMAVLAFVTGYFADRWLQG